MSGRRPRKFVENPALDANGKPRFQHLKPFIPEELKYTVSRWKKANGRGWVHGYVSVGRNESRPINRKFIPSLLSICSLFDLKMKPLAEGAHGSSTLYIDWTTPLLNPEVITKRRDSRYALANAKLRLKTAEAEMATARALKLERLRMDFVASVVLDAASRWPEVICAQVGPGILKLPGLAPVELGEYDVGIAFWPVFFDTFGVEYTTTKIYGLTSPGIFKLNVVNPTPDCAVDMFHPHVYSRERGRVCKGALDVTSGILAAVNSLHNWYVSTDGSPADRAWFDNAQMWWQTNAAEWLKAYPHALYVEAPKAQLRAEGLARTLPMVRSYEALVGTRMFGEPAPHLFCHDCGTDLGVYRRERDTENRVGFVEETAWRLPTHDLTGGLPRRFCQTCFDERHAALLAQAGTHWPDHEISRAVFANRFERETTYTCNWPRLAMAIDAPPVCARPASRWANASFHGMRFICAEHYEVLSDKPVTAALVAPGWVERVIVEGDTIGCEHEECGIRGGHGPFNGARAPGRWTRPGTGYRTGDPGYPAYYMCDKHVPLAADIILPEETPEETPEVPPIRATNVTEETPLTLPAEVPVPEVLRDANGLEYSPRYTRRNPARIYDLGTCTFVLTGTVCCGGPVAFDGTGPIRYNHRCEEHTPRRIFDGVTTGGFRDETATEMNRRVTAARAARAVQV